MKLLLTGDWQVRDDVPLCRTDNYFEAMERKMNWIVDAAIEHKVRAVLHSGDLFDRGRPMQAQLLEILVMRVLRKLSDAGIAFLAVPGNHDLPYHQLNEVHRSSFGVIADTGLMEDITGRVEQLGEGVSVFGAAWTQDLPTAFPDPEASFRIGLWHVGVNMPGEEDLSTAEMFTDFPEYDLIVTGHNHQYIAERHDAGTHIQEIVNPGSMMRENIDQIDFTPSVTIFDTEALQHERLFIPIGQGVISREHKDAQVEKDEKIAAVVESMRGEYEIGLGFEANLEAHLKANPVNSETERIIYELIE